MTSLIPPSNFIPERPLPQRDTPNSLPITRRISLLELFVVWCGVLVYAVTVVWFGLLLLHTLLNSL